MRDGVELIQSTNFPNSFARWYPDTYEDDVHPTHIAHTVARDALRTRIIEAARARACEPTPADEDELLAALEALDAREALADG